MVEKLEIPIIYEENKNRPIPGLLITVDCQYGARNVTKLEADDVVIIDHHQQEITDVKKTYINSSLGKLFHLCMEAFNGGRFSNSGTQESADCPLLWLIDGYRSVCRIVKSTGSGFTGWCEL